jgi:hypothetical protein
MMQNLLAASALASRSLAVKALHLEQAVRHGRQLEIPRLILTMAPPFWMLAR